MQCRENQKGFEGLTCAPLFMLVSAYMSCPNEMNGAAPVDKCSLT